MNTEHSFIDADVLIIGGGSAGAMAAIRAKEVNPDQKVVVFEKGQMKYSGCIARGMDAMNIVAIPDIATAELYVESNSIACEGIMDEPVNYKMAERSYEMMKKLESWDVCFPKDDNGDYEVLKIHPKGRFCVTMKEPELKAILANKALDLGVLVMNRTMAVRLLKDGERISGAIGMNVRTGEMLVCRAKSVILSSGGTARFGLPDNGHLYGVYDFPGNTGDGYCLAYRAGAELSGFEYTLVYYITKDINAPLLYITLTRGATLLNAFDERRDQDHPNPAKMLLEHMDGKGPIRIRMDHLPEEKIKEIEEILFTTERPACERFHAGRDNDFRTGEIEMWPTEVYLCGGHGLTGVRVNENAETNVPGLYAAGDTSLVARGHLSGALVIGEVAAESASEYAAGNGEVTLDDDQVESFKRELETRLAQKNNPIAIEEFEFKVRRMISDYLKPPKNEYKLDRALWWMDRFRKELKTMVRVANVHDLFKCFEVENIIQSATMCAIASKERKESRWSPWHYRTDYPEKNDAEWKKHIVLTCGSVPEDVKVSYKPIIKMEGRV
ncbi:MAG: FAD-binding protein [Deltaproteobacteria bacterium]|jgi:succinate dehydrogenase/fumarate reductase flavoprotein subunit|nr:FAD-binding protein [Deltaproteobacteria bacterium]MBT4263422.1 FAD-binding protein [Deltaproteobacteria bacterium]MBT4638419.1 FAD-binding protein [Deltaproteobacteria bacterium]MBT6502137.1 FAD-binding protein [Deltaproteobacteria bacterium]MBT7151754.1 FAD-binding protein [Deltaproteobacteria bacterium]